MIPAEIPSWVGDYVGVPHLPDGRTREGADCWGLLSLAYNEHSGRILPPYGGPAWRRGMRDADKAPIGQQALAYSERFERVPLGEERLFDGILFAIKGFPIHVGLVVHPGWMLHVQVGADATVERYRPAMMWEHRIVGVFRHV